VQHALLQQAARSEPMVDVFRNVRGKTLSLSAPLELDDYAVQSMSDASPIKWHLAHTSWFFEQFVLKKYLADYRPLDVRYERLFNSYYQTLGAVYAHEARHLLTRPTLTEVMRYRHYVDEHVDKLLTAQSDNGLLNDAATLGVHHEQQHQELILTDIKHAFSRNPLLPAYRSEELLQPGLSRELKFTQFSGGVKMIGAELADGVGFAFDNELPRHRVWVEPFALANRLVTNAEYLAFVRTGGYRRPEHWLSDGWDAVNREGWDRPLYWSESLDSEFTLRGMASLNMNGPVCHLSYYEADAFARWAGMRLPTESEWEVATENISVTGNLLEEENFHPAPAAAEGVVPRQLFGDAWEWTSSAYAAYPGYAAGSGALGEYNGKFMCNQFVLRGGSCLTPRDHVRATYRNFFRPEARWQCTGIRLAR